MKPQVVLLPVVTARGVDWTSWRAGACGALALLGLVLSGYLVWVHQSGTFVLCAGTGDCAIVQSSRFANVAGVPVALLGAGLYAAILALALLQVRASGTTADVAGLGVFGLALAGTLYSAYLTYLELFVIGAVCPWCVASAVLVTAICGLAAWDLVAAGDVEDRGGTCAQA
jgi:uncharacterized membrane protein